MGDINVLWSALRSGILCGIDSLCIRSYIR